MFPFYKSKTLVNSITKLGFVCEIMLSSLIPTGQSSFVRGQSLLTSNIVQSISCLVSNEGEMKDP